MSSKKEQDWRVGLFFHTFSANGKVHHQGKVLKTRPGGAFVVRLFSWLDGSATGDHVEPESYLAGAKFYETDEDMVAAHARSSGQDADEAVDLQRRMKEVFGQPASRKARIAKASEVSRDAIDRAKKKP